MFISKKKLEALINQETEKRLREYDEKRWQDERLRELERKALELEKLIHGREACTFEKNAPVARSV